MTLGNSNFNPRPPRGGRLSALVWIIRQVLFQYTSSARRTTRSARCSLLQARFQSTSSARRTTQFSTYTISMMLISIHVLREEDDFLRTGVLVFDNTYFNPRPPRGGRLCPSACSAACACISIHVLREEDDFLRLLFFLAGSSISIHVLREEDDGCAPRSPKAGRHFNPRPPRGGRPARKSLTAKTTRFQSTSSARRTTSTLRRPGKPGQHFNPRPPRGGRQSHRASEPWCSWISIHVLREEDDVRYARD